MHYLKRKIAITVIVINPNAPTTIPAIHPALHEGSKIYISEAIDTCY